MENSRYLTIGLKCDIIFFDELCNFTTQEVKQMSLKESGEMYLETIFLLSKEKKAVRSIDIAEEMNYSKPSVSRAVGILKSEKYISVDNDGYITLTKTGAEVAERIYERHTILTKLFTALGVDEKTASEDACRIEHVISDKTFLAVKNHFEEHN